MRHYTTQEQKELADRFFLLVIIIVIPLVVMTVIWQMIQFHLTLNTLTSLSPKQETFLKIYARTKRPVGTPRTFTSPTPLIHDFLQTLTDIRTYRSTRYDTLISDDHRWLLEIETPQGKIIQILCSIFVEKPGTVVGRLGKFHEKNTTYYGDFQSRKLFQWYQKYSHLWLEPVESTPQQDTSHEVK